MANKVRATDTVEGLANAFIEAAKGIPPVPKHLSLRKQDEPYWVGIVSNKPRDEWTDVQLAAAVQLARVQADLVTWAHQLDMEDVIVIVGPHDSPRANPLLAVIEAATRRQLALMRSLGLANKEDLRDAAKRQNVMRKAHATRDAVKTNPLIAS